MMPYLIFCKEKKKRQKNKEKIIREISPTFKLNFSIFSFNYFTMNYEIKKDRQTAC